MESFIVFNLTMLWFVIIAVSILLLRVVRYHRARFDFVTEQSKVPELEIGETVPDFEAHTLEGESVNLAHFAERAVVFVFLSPTCGFCDLVLPKLARLKPITQTPAGVSLILVSNANADKTRKWLAKLASQNDLSVDWDVLITSRYGSFENTYNPRGYHPYYVLINNQGLVQSRGNPQGDEWGKVERYWEGKTDTIKPLTHYYH